MKTVKVKVLKKHLKAAIKELKANGGAERCNVCLISQAVKDKLKLSNIYTAYGDLNNGIVATLVEYKTLYTFDKTGVKLMSKFDNMKYKELEKLLPKTITLTAVNPA